MIAIIDYGAGNIFSVQNALHYLGVRSILTADPEQIQRADRIILPGVGAFPDAMRMLAQKGLVDLLKTQDKPLMGICLGMQMLFDKSYEFGETEGLGLIPGCVKLMQPEGLVIPHIGWNKLEPNSSCALSDAVEKDSYVYFVHSFAADCDSENVAYYCDYGGRVPALVFKDNVYGCQFHPEKSGDIGLAILEKFSRI